MRMVLFQHVELFHVNQVIPIDKYDNAIHSCQWLYVMIGLYVWITLLAMIHDDHNQQHSGASL